MRPFTIQTFHQGPIEVTTFITFFEGTTRIKGFTSHEKAVHFGNRLLAQLNGIGAKAIRTMCAVDKGIIIELKRGCLHKEDVIDGIYRLAVSMIRKLPR